MPKFTIAVLVKNEFGVLHRVTSMFRRRQFNINSLTVSETETEEFSRITVTYEGEADFNHQIKNQLRKLPDVCKVKETPLIAQMYWWPEMVLVESVLRVFLPPLPGERWIWGNFLRVIICPPKTLRACRISLKLIRQHCLRTKKYL